MGQCRLPFKSDAFSIFGAWLILGRGDTCLPAVAFTGSQQTSRFRLAAATGWPAMQFGAAIVFLFEKGRLATFVGLPSLQLLAA
jgi:hypothetical protein